MTNLLLDLSVAYQLLFAPLLVIFEHSIYMEIINLVDVEFNQKY